MCSLPCLILPRDKRFRVQCAGAITFLYVSLALRDTRQIYLMDSSLIVFSTRGREGLLSVHNVYEYMNREGGGDAIDAEGE